MIDIAWQKQTAGHEQAFDPREWQTARIMLDPVCPTVAKQAVRIAQVKFRNRLVTTRRFMFVALLMASMAARATGCLPGGDERTINAALATPGAIVELCQGATFTLNAPVVLSRDGQQLRTAKKTGKAWAPATLRVNGAEQATAIGSRASGIVLDQLVVDGRRRELGLLAKGGALIELGGDGVHDVHVDHLRALDPRGWSTLHAFEGNKSCTGIVIENSHFGPAGRPENGEWADGISLACRHSTVRHNLIEDASDGAIVVFGAPGSLIEDNDIVTYRNVLLGGINLVDYKPYDGDYTGTRVVHNRIRGAGGFVKIGIAIGPSVWGADNTEYIRGAVITDNLITGEHVGYAIAADGAQDIELRRNRILSPFGGEFGPGCYKDGKLKTAPALVNSRRVTGLIDPGMIDTPVRFAICIQPKMPQATQRRAR